MMVKLTRYQEVGDKATRRRRDIFDERKRQERPCLRIVIIDCLGHDLRDDVPALCAQKQ